MFARSSLARLARINFENPKKFSTSAVKRAHGPGGAGVYRYDAPPVTYGPRITIRTCFQTYVWFHIFYNFWYYCDIMLGHPKYTLPKPELWTDEELGIPPDDYDEEV